jgi:hypothetical protein
MLNKLPEATFVGCVSVCTYGGVLEEEYNCLLIGRLARQKFPNDVIIDSQLGDKHLMHHAFR